MRAAAFVEGGGLAPSELHMVKGKQVARKPAVGSQHSTSICHPRLRKRSHELVQLGNGPKLSKQYLLDTDTLGRDPYIALS